MAYPQQIPANFLQQQQINPYLPQFPSLRYGPMENNTVNYLKGRPVTSIDEARVAQIDFDGTLNIFTDIANKRIYTKQINMDGTSSFNIYCLTEPEPEKPVQTQEIDLKDYVTKEELNTLLSQVTGTISALEQKMLEERAIKTSSKF